MADFAFVYGGGKGKDDFMDRLRTIMQSLTPPVTLIDKQKLNGSRVGTLNEAIRYLSTPPITRVDKLILGTHSGTFNTVMPMFRSQIADKKHPQDTVYETLERTITPVDADHTITMPVSITGTPPPKCTVLVKGCNIGKSPPFVIKWSEALGPNVEIITPRHFDALTKEDDWGMWESLAYQWQVFSPTKLDPDDMRAAFVAKSQVPGKFDQFVDNTDVPPEYWKDKRWYRPRLNLNAKHPKNSLMSLDFNIGTKKNIWILRGLDVKPQKHFVPVVYDTEAALPDPTDVDACKASIKVRLPQVYPRYKGRLEPGGHPFPDFERWGYDDVPSYVDGFVWKFERMPPQGTHQFVIGCNGERWAYTVIMPVTDPNPTPQLVPLIGKVRTNFFPNAGFSKVPLPSPLPVGLDLNNPNLFFRV